MRIVRLLVAALFVALLALILSTGAFLYHLAASSEPVDLDASGSWHPGMFARVNGMALADSGFVVGYPPVKLRLVPLAKRQDLWLLFSARTGYVQQDVEKVFSGRLEHLRRIPFARHLAGKQTGLAAQTWVLEVGNRPRRLYAWMFITVFGIAFAGSQLLLFVLQRVRRQK